MSVTLWDALHAPGGPGDDGGGRVMVMTVGVMVRWDLPRRSECCARMVTAGLGEDDFDLDFYPSMDRVTLPDMA